jgi:Fe-S-cluster-containing hydrogenase component 2
MKRIAIDISKCTGCGQCVYACAFKHVGAFDAKASCIQLARWENRSLSVPVLCHQCENTPCVAVCPVDALTIDSQTGAIILGKEVCIQCDLCISDCPHKIIRKTDDGFPFICDLCGGEPRCVEVCYPSALTYDEYENSNFNYILLIVDTLTAKLTGKNVTPPEELLIRGELKNNESE